MHFISGIKIGAIKLADFINSLHDPFSEFIRPTEEKYPETLVDKAHKFDMDMYQNFHLFEHSVNNYRIPLTEPIDTGDQALWHGIYTAMWALKYSVTNDLADLTVVKASMVGLNMHQTFHQELQASDNPFGIRKRRLIRGMREDGFWQDDASSDSLTGHIAGIYFAWLYGDLEVKNAAVILADGIATELLNNKFCLVNADGSPTTHGKLINGILTDPLNLGLCLTVFRVAYEITGRSEYLQTYHDLLDQYGNLAAYGKVRLLWWDTRYDSHRVAIHLSILADLESDTDVKENYVKGLERVWNMERKSGNAWITFLYARHSNISHDELEVCKKSLKEFTQEDKNVVIQKINSTTPGIETFGWGTDVLSKQPLPKWKIGSQDFFWQRHLNAVDTWVGQTVPNQVYNGGDFLVTYWLGRKLNLIGETE